MSSVELSDDHGSPAGQNLLARTQPMGKPDPHLRVRVLVWVGPGPRPGGAGIWVSHHCGPILALIVTLIASRSVVAMRCCV
jgi:hypothetical protein